MPAGRERRAGRDIRTEDAAIDATGIRVQNLPIRIENLLGETAP